MIVFSFFYLFACQCFVLSCFNGLRICSLLLYWFTSYVNWFRQMFFSVWFSMIFLHVHGTSLDLYCLFMYSHCVLLVISMSFLYVHCLCIDLHYSCIHFHRSLLMINGVPMQFLHVHCFCFDLYCMFMGFYCVVSVSSYMSLYIICSLLLYTVVPLLLLT